MPDGAVRESITVKVLVAVSVKSLRPSPSTIGQTRSRYSSINLRREASR